MGDPVQVEGLKKRVSVAAIRALAILGQNDEVWRAVGRPGHSGRGVRILAMDGGGMKVRGFSHAVLGHNCIEQGHMLFEHSDEPRNITAWLAHSWRPGEVQEVWPCKTLRITHSLQVVWALFTPVGRRTVNCGHVML